MKSNYFGLSLCILFAAVGTNACMLGFESLKGSGLQTFVEKDESGFTQVEFGYGCKATVTSGESYSVVIQIDDNLVDHLRVERDGEMLKIGLQPYKSYRDFNFTADLTMPDIRGIHLSGGSDGKLNGFVLDHELKISLSGGSELTGDVSADPVSLSLSGGSEVSLLGKSTSVSVDGSGGSWFGLEQFQAQYLEFELSGGSSARVRVDNRLSGNASGGSMVYYSGPAILGEISKSGGSKVIQR